jgi:protein TonB
MPRNPLRSHLSGSVPASIAVHVAVLLVLVVLPLVDVVAPVPLMMMPSYVLAAPAPPPPAVVPQRRAAAAAPRVRTGAPGTPPNAILPEPPVAIPLTPAGSIEPGLPPGFGEPAGLALSAAPAPPPQPPPPQAVRAAQLPEVPRKVADVHPAYPEVARQARVEGTVILEGVIDTTGRVTQLRVLRSVPLLDQAALEAVRQWRYTPSTYGGRPVSVLMTITVRFTLSQ